ncbi:GtrA family protein [Paenibacillus sp. NPDC056579]|uniref:GtrA family protein n=1 Tax=Paenibacillus sp. NPDC056579 TaxID=3345871 RepID=UPI00368FC7A5
MIKLLQHSFVRFLMVGVFNTLVGLGTSFLLFNLLDLGYWPATFLGNTIGAIVSYVLNKKFTFRSEVSVKNSWWKFMLVILCCYGVSYGVSNWLGQVVLRMLPHVKPVWVHNAAILVGSGLYTISNYFGHKYFTFRSRTAGSPMTN